MARRVKSKGMLGGLVSKKMMWYGIYGVAGYYIYQWYMGNQQHQQMITAVPPVIINP